MSLKNKYIDHAIEYRSDDVTKNFFAFQRFGYHVSVEHDEKHPQPKGPLVISMKISPSRVEK